MTGSDTVNIRCMLWSEPFAQGAGRLEEEGHTVADTGNWGKLALDCCSRSRFEVEPVDSEAEGADNPGSHSYKAVDRACIHCKRQTAAEAVGDNHNLKNIIANSVLNRKFLFNNKFNYSNTYHKVSNNNLP